MAWILWPQVLPQRAGLKEHPAEQREVFNTVTVRTGEKRWAFLMGCQRTMHVRRSAFPAACWRMIPVFYPAVSYCSTKGGQEEELTACKEKKNASIFAFVFLQAGEGYLGPGKGWKYNHERCPPWTDQWSVYSYFSFWQWQWERLSNKSVGCRPLSAAHSSVHSRAPSHAPNTSCRQAEGHCYLRGDSRLRGKHHGTAAWWGSQHLWPPTAELSPGAGEDTHHPHLTLQLQAADICVFLHLQHYTVSPVWQTQIRLCNDMAMFQWFPRVAESCK